MNRGTGSNLTRKQIAALKKSVKTKINDGRLRSAVAASAAISPAQLESIMTQACRQRWIKSVAANNGELRLALERAAWLPLEIDFLMYRSRSVIYK
jgi:type II secretory pathway component PulM